MADLRAGIDRLPGLRLARTYRPEWLTPDLLAGLTVWALLVPQALAYAQLAGVDPVVGLYAAIGAIIGYLVFGSVRTLSCGPEGTIALLAAATVAPLAAGDPTTYLALMGTLSLLSGGWLILAGILRLGFVTRFLSRPLLTGYVAGSAIVMIVSQLDSLLGIPLEAADDTLAELRETLQRLGETDPLTLLVGVIVMVTAVSLRRIDRRLPAYLIAMLVAIAISAFFDLADQGVAVVGEVEPGLPSFGLPSFSLGDVGGSRWPGTGHRPAGVRRQWCHWPGACPPQRRPGGRQPGIRGAGCRQRGCGPDRRIPGQRQPVPELHGGGCRWSLPTTQRRRPRPRRRHTAGPDPSLRSAAEVGPGRGHPGGRVWTPRPWRIQGARTCGSEGAGPGDVRGLRGRRGRHVGRRARHRGHVTVPGGGAGRAAESDVPGASAGDGLVPRRGRRRVRPSASPASLPIASTGPCSSRTLSCSPTTSRQRWPNRRSHRLAGSSSMWKASATWTPPGSGCSMTFAAPSKDAASRLVLARVKAPVRAYLERVGLPRSPRTARTSSWRSTTPWPPATGHSADGRPTAGKCRRQRRPDGVVGAPPARHEATAQHRARAARSGPGSVRQRVARQASRVRCAWPPLSSRGSGRGRFRRQGRHGRGGGRGSLLDLLGRR